MPSTHVLAQMPGFFTVTATAQETLGRKRSLQAERRRSEIWTDQHGREWAAEMDMKSGHPCTPLVPNGWAAPILPPTNVFEFSTGRSRPLTTISYRAWREYQGTLQAEYEDHVKRLAARMFPNSWAREIELNNPLIMQEAGPPPYAVDFVEACASGSRWALGLSTVKPKWLTPELEQTLPRKRRQLIATARVKHFDDAGPEADVDTPSEIADRMARAARFDDLDDEPVARRAPRGRKTQED